MNLTSDCFKLMGFPGRKNEWVETKVRRKKVVDIKWGKYCVKGEIN